MQKVKISQFIKVPTIFFYLKEESLPKISVSIVKKILYLQEEKLPKNVRCYCEKKTVENKDFLFWKKNCKQNLDSYCPDSADLKYIQFLCVLATQRALK